MPTGIDPALIAALKDSFGAYGAFFLLVAVVIGPMVVLIIKQGKATKAKDESRGFSDFDLLQMQNDIELLKERQAEDRQRIVALEIEARSRGADLE